MGDLAAMHSINRVLKAHREELTAEVELRVRPFLDALRVAPSRVQVLFRNEMTHLDAWLAASPARELTEHDQEPAAVMVATYDIDELADRFPDCEVGY